MAPPRRIGLDLDNTIIDYAQAYRAVAEEMGLSPRLFARDSIREVLRKSEEDDEDWQRFQAMLYTDGLSYAQPAAGLLDFLSLCNSLGVNVVIISHKTKATPERFGARDLRAPASAWLQDQGITPDHVTPDRVFYCPDRAEKIQTIATTKCDVFIDDLAEVLSDPKMPDDVTLFHYVADIRSATEMPHDIVYADFFALTSWLRTC